MNNDIQESYCSFEVSKLLKEKGCDKIKIDYGLNQILNSDNNSTVTHALAIEWVRVNFYYHIESQMDIPQKGEQDGCFVWNGVIKTDENYKVKIVHKTENKSSPQEATEAALLYTLKELIP